MKSFVDIKFFYFPMTNLGQLLANFGKLLENMAEYLANSRTFGFNRMFGHSRISGFLGSRRFGRIVGRIVGRMFCRRKIRFNTAFGN